MAKADETYIQDVHFIFTKHGYRCWEGYTRVPFGNRQWTNKKYQLALCVKRGVNKPLQGLFLSHTARCPSMFTGMGLRGGANHLYDITGNFNQGVPLSTPVFLCQSSASKAPATHSKKDDVLVVMGSHFAKSGNKVTVGGVDCPVKSESEVELRCTPPPRREAVETACHRVRGSAHGRSCSTQPARVARGARQCA